MSFDGLMTKAISEEIADTLTTGRISRIYQPFKTELIFTIRSQGKNHQLLLSANPSFARVHITKEKYDNPSTPPMFCMLLRKHLEGSIIESIQQIEMERIIMIDLKGKNEIGDVSYKRLMIEIMGRHSNIILLDRETNKILDSIKHISLAQSSQRTVLPGQDYTMPPAQEKTNPFSVDEEGFIKKIDFNKGKLDKQILEQFSGLSPVVTKEIVHRAGMANKETLANVFFEVVTPLAKGDYQPQMIVTDSKEYFSIINLTHVSGEVRTFDSTSELLDRYYYGKAERDRVKQQAHDLERFLKNELQKNVKKIKKLERTLDDAEKAKKFQKYGELLTANLYAINRGEESVEVIDYYDENGSTVSISLDPQKSPSDNAQNYFKKYNKAKNSVQVVQDQIQKAEEEIQYLEQLIQQMETASPGDIEEIREELIEEGYIRKRQKGGNRKKKNVKPQIEQYVSSSGIEMLVGKNNKQNEYVTNRLARQDEIWLHTKDIPGSHVVIRSIEPDETTLLEAANLAAYFSKARQSSSVPVDYTKIRHVKKPNGSKPGFVIYDNQTTIYVTPDADLVLQLRK
ncbi:Rqc2 family fibronectin-binding protein [Bacillus sp. FJAT-45350]|uniref:Rqc2 family fibronectin-binding protein n=1 Tax=Bacillus sp. FJAT-45350 TaxID=2011014 RepID=UPI000BB78FF8|nr:NFACT RNA binding domain-containing protein [Bacillus sp. FJAT-45350]